MVSIIVGLVRVRDCCYCCQRIWNQGYLKLIEVWLKRCEVLWWPVSLTTIDCVMNCEALIMKEALRRLVLPWLGLISCQLSFIYLLMSFFSVLRVTFSKLLGFTLCAQHEQNLPLEHRLFLLRKP